MVTPIASDPQPGDTGTQQQKLPETLEISSGTGVCTQQQQVLTKTPEKSDKPPLYMVTGMYFRVYTVCITP